MILIFFIAAAANGNKSSCMNVMHNLDLVSFGPLTCFMKWVSTTDASLPFRPLFLNRWVQAGNMQTVLPRK